MELALTEAEQKFRASVRSWLEGNTPAGPYPSLDTAAGFAWHRDWERRLHEARLAVVHWPAAFGGRDATIVEWLLFEEEYYRADAPKRVGQNGLFLLAPTLFEYGTGDQRARYLPATASGAIVWAQAWSEPGAGSDLAAIRSPARRTEGGWLLDGQKTWSSRAAFADRGFGLFRSDPDAGRHKGLTYYLFPLDAPGVTVRPIRQLDGETGFAEIFFDGVFVPDADVLGAPGQGWAVAMSTTGSERGLMLRSPGRFMAAADRLVELCRRLGDAVDPALRSDVAQCWLAADAYRLYTFAAAGRVAGGERLGAESSLNKLFWSELDVTLQRTALRLLGPLGTLTQAAPAAVDGGRWLDDFLFSLAGPIYAGTNEIQRNVVAERVLGLPREA